MVDDVRSVCTVRCIRQRTGTCLCVGVFMCVCVACVLECVVYVYVSVCVCVACVLECFVYVYVSVCVCVLKCVVYICQCVWVCVCVCVCVCVWCSESP